MSKSIIIILIMLSSLTAFGSRVRENFDLGWEFHLGDLRIDRAVKAGKYGGITDWHRATDSEKALTIAYNDKEKAPRYDGSQWRPVTLPHDWCVEQPFVNDSSVVIDGAPAGLVSHGFLPVGIGFYRKEFDIPESDRGKRISIDFDGIFRNSTVWVNGHLMGRHESGYTPSHYDLTDVLRYGDEGRNAILVKVDARDFEGWWYEGAGIYRHVWLVKTDPLHIERYGTFVTTPEIAPDKAEVNIQTAVANEYEDPKHFTILSKITDAWGNVADEIESEVTLQPLSQIEISHNGAIQKPELWSPETPRLYKVLTYIINNGDTVDNYVTTFGVRTAEMRTDGFYLNGKLYPLKGTVNHQDHAGVGTAIPDKLNRYRVRLLKDMGSNAYRTGHHPPTPELLDICDEEGMLFLDENRLLSSTEDGLKELETLIMRDRNHPCVFMWCLENEETIEGSAIGMRILRSMVNTAHKLDPTRQTTAAINRNWHGNGYSDPLDVVGYNYGQRGNQYANDKKDYPSRPVMVTESTSFVATRGEYSDNFSKGYVSNLGNGVGWGNIPGKEWKEYLDYPFIGGCFVWTGFDYRGEPTPIYRWPSVTSHFGLMDMCGFPKDSYYAYKAAWTDEDIVHIFPHWNWPEKTGQKICVMGYTNCDEVELIVNGKSQGRKPAEQYGRMKWNVIYRPGKIEARGYKNGKHVASDIHETTGRPATISISPDCQTIDADASGLAIINIALTDSKGRVVPTADNHIQFTVDGPGRIIGTGNGNPSSTEPDKANSRKAFNGYCQVLLQSTGEPGKISFTASSQGLRPSTIVITGEKRESPGSSHNLKK